jgi:hypothetical protein
VLRSAMVCSGPTIANPHVPNSTQVSLARCGTPPAQPYRSYYLQLSPSS